MNLSFSTRGWKSLSWDDHIRDAEEYGFQGIEVYNLTHWAAWTDKGGPFHKYHQNETWRDLHKRGIVIPCLDTPIDLSTDKEEQDDILFLIETAVIMHIPYLAVCALHDRENIVEKHLHEILPEIRKNNLLFE